MKEQYRNTSANEPLGQQLELDLRVDDNIICTRVCDGVSQLLSKGDAELTEVATNI